MIMGQLGMIRHPAGSSSVARDALEHPGREIDEYLIPIGFVEGFVPRPGVGFECDILRAALAQRLGELREPVAAGDRVIATRDDQDRYFGGQARGWASEESQPICDAEEPEDIGLEAKGIRDELRDLGLVAAEPLEAVRGVARPLRVERAALHMAKGA